MASLSKHANPTVAHFPTKMARYFPTARGKQTTLQFSKRLYCEAEHTQDEVVYSGSEDDAYENPDERRDRYETKARRFLHGQRPIILSGSLQGLFTRESGWQNPWQSTLRYKTTKNTPSRAANALAKDGSIRARQVSPGELTACSRGVQAATTPTTSNPFPLEDEATAESIKESVTGPHPFLKPPQYARVKDWQQTIVADGLARDDFWISDKPSEPSDANRKRQSGSEWLLRSKASKRPRIQLFEAAPVNSPSAQRGTGLGKGILTTDLASPADSQEPLTLQKPEADVGVSDHEPDPLPSSAPPSVRASDAETAERARLGSQPLQLPAFNLSPLELVMPSLPAIDPSPIRLYQQYTEHGASDKTESEPDGQVHKADDTAPKPNVADDLESEHSDPAAIPCDVARTGDVDHSFESHTDNSFHYKSNPSKDGAEATSPHEHSQHDTETRAAGLLAVSGVLGDAESNRARSAMHESRSNAANPSRAAETPERHVLPKQYMLPSFGFQDDCEQKTLAGLGSTVEGPTLVASQSADGSSAMVPSPSPETRMPPKDASPPPSSRANATSPLDFGHNRSWATVSSQTNQLQDCGAAHTGTIDEAASELNDAVLVGPDEDKSWLTLDQDASQSQVDTSLCQSQACNEQAKHGQASLASPEPSSTRGQSRSNSPNVATGLDSSDHDTAHAESFCGPHGSSSPTPQLPSQQSPWVRETVTTSLAVDLVPPLPNAALAETPQSPWQAVCRSHIAHVTPSRSLVPDLSSPAPSETASRGGQYPELTFDPLSHKKVDTTHAPTKQLNLPTPDLSTHSQDSSRKNSPAKSRQLGSLAEKQPAGTPNTLPDALANPWAKRSASRQRRRQEKKKPRKSLRVSFAPLPCEEGYDEIPAGAYSPAATDDMLSTLCEAKNREDEQELESQLGAELPTVSPKTRLTHSTSVRSTSPPLEVNAIGLPGEDEKFGKHFAAMAGKRSGALRPGMFTRNGLRRSLDPDDSESIDQEPKPIPSWNQLLPTASQQNCATPAVTAMAEAFLDVDRRRKEEGRVGQPSLRSCRHTYNEDEDEDREIELGNDSSISLGMDKHAFQSPAARKIAEEGAENASTCLHEAFFFSEESDDADDECLDNFKDFLENPWRINDAPGMVPSKQDQWWWGERDRRTSGGPNSHSSFLLQGKSPSVGTQGVRDNL